jgi:uncharacterized coiled-coil protein SlyX
MTLKRRIKQMEKKTKIVEKNTLAELEVTQRGKEIIELLEQLDTLKERIKNHEN